MVLYKVWEDTVHEKREQKNAQKPWQPTIYKSCNSIGAQENNNMHSRGRVVKKNLSRVNGKGGVNYQYVLI